ncbi:hypothetical protein [Streptomyces sp. NPDC006863]|uniref:hypothetical protein n=1 Tax=Streptomyces sp. NPDC006863 TaxID=3154779 RepID=UPI0034115583
MSNGHLVKIGSQAHGLYDRLWGRARVAVRSCDKGADGLSRPGFALGGGLKHVANRWGEQLIPLMDSCDI